MLVLLRPVLPIQKDKTETFKMDIVLAMDISPSMLSRDIYPDRLTRAKQEISSLLNHLPAYRTALVLFSGQALLQVPMTVDYGAIKLLLNDIQPDYISSKGTNFFDALRTAETALKPSPPDFKKLVILLTDGEDHSSALESVINEMKKRGIIVYCIGIGSEAGAPIPVFDEKGNIVDYKKDKQGNPIISRLHGDVLTDIARQTGGQVYFVDQTSFNLSTIVSNIENIEKEKSLVEVKVAGYQELFQYFLAVALFFMVLAIIISSRVSMIAMIFALIMFYHNTTYASDAFNYSEWKNNQQGNYHIKTRAYNKAIQNYLRNTAKKNINPVSHYNLANTLAGIGKPEEASKEWQKTLEQSKNKKLRSEVYFNQSVVNIKQQNYSEAKNNLINTLKSNPHDQDAKKNLELVLQMLKLNRNQQKQRSSENNQQNKQQENKDKGQTQKQDSKYSKKDAEQILDNFNNNKVFTPQNKRDRKDEDQDW
ncbi:MAG: VWA domain-containing protein [Candidatus Margulisbacteria bacterium]|nr:VWA domain-containing protein [Candidatus Margulisiibacteriota bacterium]